MSLKDALNKGVGGYNYSAENYQSVAIKLNQSKQKGSIKLEKYKVTPENSVINKISRKSNNYVKMKVDLNKVALSSFGLSQFSASGNVEDFKDFHDPILGLSSMDYSFLEKSSEESYLNIQNKLLTECNETTISEKVEDNKNSLLSKGNIAIKINNSVNEVPKVIKNVSTIVDAASQNKGKELKSVLISTHSNLRGTSFLIENDISCEETSDNSEITLTPNNVLENKPIKKRGGWPKGRKRKPEVKHEIRPPKAPATGYVLFLNERRKDYRDMPFTEV